MAMRRRAFLELCAGGAAAGLVGCMPEVAPVHRDESDPIDPGGAAGGVRRDGGTGGGETPHGSDAGPAGGVVPADGGSGSPAHDAGASRGDTDAGPACDDFVVMYDTYAQSLYFDGSLGPTTGIVRAQWAAAGDAVELEFWHGHGGVSHRFTVTSSHFESLKRGERVTIETTEVDSHTHQLFVDPTDPRYRVPGAAPLPIPLC